MTGSNAFSAYGRAGKTWGDAAPRTVDGLLVSLWLISVSLRLVGDAYRLAFQRWRAKHGEAEPSAESGSWAVFLGNSLFHFLDFSFYFFCPLGIELFFVGGKLAQQSQKLSNVYKFLVRYFLEHFHGELVVG